MQDEKPVLGADDIRRTLVRIAHEIVERNAGERVAVVGIHRRGAILAARIHELLSEIRDEPVPLGDIDIAFYRDDLNLRAAGRQPVVHASHIEFPIEDYTVVLVDDVLYTGRTVRAGVEAIFDYGRPRPGQPPGPPPPGDTETPGGPGHLGQNPPPGLHDRP